MAKTVYQPLDANTLLKYGRDDPWYAIGLALGNAGMSAYMDNYNNRGIQKAANAGMNDLNDMAAKMEKRETPTETYNKKFDDLKSNTKIENPYNENNIDISLANKTLDKMQQTPDYQNGLANMKGADGKPLTVGDALNAEALARQNPGTIQTQSLQSPGSLAYGIQGTPAPTPQVRGGATTAATAPVAAGSPEAAAATTTAGITGTSVNPVTGLPTNLSWSKADYVNQWMAKQRAAGRSEYQIQEALKLMQPGLDSMEKKVNDAQDAYFMNILMPGNNNGQPVDLSNPTNVKALMSWAQRNPTSASLFMKQMNDIDNKSWRQKQWDYKMERAQKTYEASERNYALRAANAAARAAGGGSRGGSVGGSNTHWSKDPDYQYTLSQIKALENKEERTPDEEEDLKYFHKWANDWVQYNNGPARPKYEKKQATQQQGETAQEPKQTRETNLTDEAEQQRQQSYNKGQALQAAARAGLYVNEYTGEVMPASPYANPTAEQNAAYEEWKKHFGNI